MSASSGFEPTIIQRDAQPYVAIKEAVTMSELGRVADRIPEVLTWLVARGIEPAGPPFFKYDVIDMAGFLEVEVGMAVRPPAVGDGAVIDGVLPAGRYATLTHIGHPDNLEPATARLLDWAAGQGLRWDRTQTAAGEMWGARLELYRTDPGEQPDMSRWETELVFRLAD